MPNRLLIPQSDSIRHPATPPRPWQATRWLVVLALCLAAAGGDLLAAPARASQNSLDHWRRLTATGSPPPRVLVKGHHLELQFPTANTTNFFRGKWGNTRVPSHKFEVKTARLVPANVSTASLARSWHEARVISSEAWSEMLLEALGKLAPLQPGEGIYYQTFLTDGVIYRSADKETLVRSIQQVPPGIRIERRLSIDETVGVLCGSLSSRFSEQYPGESLFVVLSPTSRGIAQGLLLDTRKQQSVWLSPASLYESAEGGFDLLFNARGVASLTLESHGLAILKNPVSSAARLVDFGVQTVWRFLRLPRPQFPRKAPPEGSQAGMDLPQWERWLDTYTGTKAERGDLRLLTGGQRFFPELRSSLAAATNHINMDVYIFDTDDVAVGIADLLRRKAADVRTRVIIDRMGSLSAGASPPGTPLPETFHPPVSMLKYLKSGSELRVRPFLNPWMSSDHTKLYLVDGHKAWLGGMNVGREYRYEWQDLMVELTGAVVNSLEKDFALAWAHESWLGDAAYAVALLKSAKPGVASGGSMQVRLLPTDTGWKPYSSAIFGALRHARNHIYIEHPYLFDKRITAELVHARRRGVDVRVIMPRVNDFKAGGRSNLVTANYLMQHGIRVYFYPGMTHVKAVLVDGWSCVGSANLNHLSLRLCREHNVATSDEHFASALKSEVFLPDFEKSYELTQPVKVDWVDILADFALENL